MRGKNEFGSSKWSGIFKFKTSVITLVEFSDEIPVKFALEQNYPNPFNPNTKISFSLIENNFTELKVYDILGKEVAVLKNEFMNQGTYTVNFNANILASGVYFYVLKSGHNIERKKMLLLK